MAGRTEYVIAHPNGTDTVREVKGGKAPTFATWMIDDNGDWKHMGWSFQETLADAQKKALPDFRKYGATVTATRVLPTR